MRVGSLIHPLYDEMICAPIRHTVGIDGTIEEKRLHSHSNVVDDVQRQQQRNNSIAGLRRVTS